MVRVVKKPRERRQEILAAAQALYGRQGYEQTSVQNIIDEIGIAKGTFYHYFDSKEALLVALIADVFDDVVADMERLLADEGLNAVQKFNRVFSGGVEIKMGYRPALEPLLGMYLADDGAMMREKLLQETVRRIGPLLAEIVRQGVDEGLFTARYPETCAAIVLQTSQNMGLALAPLFLAGPPGQADMAQMAAIIGGYEEAVTRVLGATPGSVKLVDVSLAERWHAGEQAAER